MLTSLINGYVSQFYSFAYSLIPDELQSQQLVIDGITAYLVSNKCKLANDSLVTDDSFKFDLKLKMLTIIFKIGVRRDSHFKTSEFLKDKNEFGKFDLFYSFSIKKRALLYLRTHTNLSIDAFCIVVNSSKVDVLQDLSVLKKHLEDSIYEGI
jgi:hypothetical protein